LNTGSLVRLEDLDLLSFDCYGTLVDWESGLLAELRPWADRHHLGLTDETLLQAFAEAEGSVQREMPALLYSEVLRRAFERIEARFFVARETKAARELAASIGRWPLFPDTKDALSRLGRRCRLVVLSNVDHASFAATRRSLDVPFHRIITAQDVSAYKPDPRMFEALITVARELGSGPERLLHVAQSLYHDHVTAKKLGLKTAFVDRRHGRSGQGATPPPQEPVSPDITVRSLGELAELLKL
jgi:2-haloalkanoic acid dehalogenase type II